MSSALPVSGLYFFRLRKIMSRTLPPCTSLVLAGSSGFCGSPQEELSTAPPSLLPLPPLSPLPQAVATRATAAAPAAHLACVAPRMECLLKNTQPLSVNIRANGTRCTVGAPICRTDRPKEGGAIQVTAAPRTHRNGANTVGRRTARSGDSSTSGPRGKTPAPRPSIWGFLLPGLVDVPTHPGARRDETAFDAEAFAAQVSGHRRGDDGAAPPGPLGEIPAGIREAPDTGQSRPGRSTPRAHHARAVPRPTTAGKVLGHWDFRAGPVPYEVLGAVTEAVPAAGSPHTAGPGGCGQRRPCE